MFSSDKRHDIWACGTPEQCKALYGSAYTETGGTIDPPTPVGNIAATIQAPNLSISSGGQIQNVGNVLGTSVSLSGQKLINGITTPNTYTPQVGAPQRVITLSPVTLPGLNLSIPRAVGMGTLPTPVAGKASYVNESLGGSALGSIGPQDLLNNLPKNLQPSSTLFYFNPQEEDLLLQQAALKQTGKASFVDGLTYDSKNNVSVSEQQKEYLYQNAVEYSKSRGLQLGAALTQEQINTLDRPMLWYVEQTVPDPTCHATGAATCPTITALMPQVYLPQDTTAMSAGGNISGRDVTLKFNQDGNGSILNTGSITASGTLSVDTHTLTNQANQVDVGEIWQKVDGGYLKTTGTVVQPGGFMSAANMELNVQALNQIGGALQKLNADGTVDAAATQAMLASLQRQLGGDFAQQTLSDHLHSEFVQQGGFGPEQLFSMAAAVALSAMGMPVVGAMVSSAMNQAFSDQGFSLGEVLKAGAVAYVVQGLTQGLNLNALPMQTIGNNIASNTITAQQLLQGAFEIAGRGLVSATVNTVAYGGSFGTALKGSVVSDLAAIAASTVGQLDFDKFFGEGGLGKIGYVTAHAALGCAASAASGTGCAGGAIGGATSALIAPLVRDGLYNGSETVTTTDNGNGTLTQTTSYNNKAFNAITDGISAVSGGLAAALAGANAGAGSTWAANEAVNNATSSKTVVQKFEDWVVGTYGDIPGTFSQWKNQLIGQMQRDYGGKPLPTDANNQLSGGGNNDNTSGTAGAVVTPSIAVPLPNGTIAMIPPLIQPGGPMLSSGNSETNVQSPSSSIGDGPQNLGGNVRLYPDGSLRTPDGKFASVAGSPAPGTTTASQFADFLSGNGVNVVGKEVVVNGPLGNRVYDIVTQDANGTLHGIEIKSGGATRNTYQEFSDQFVNRFGATATGRFAGKTIGSSTTVYLP